MVDKATVELVDDEVTSELEVPVIFELLFVKDGEVAVKVLVLDDDDVRDAFEEVDMVETAEEEVSVILSVFIGVLIDLGCSCEDVKE